MFALVGSPVAEDTESICVRIVPGATFVFTFTTKVKFAVALAARLAMLLHVYGDVEVQVHPAGPVRDTNVVLAGSISVSTTGAAAEAGPPLATVCVYVMLVPAVTGLGLAEFVTLRSACPAPATAILEVAELSFEFVSCVAEAAVAVSVMIVPAAVPAFTLNTTGKVLEEAGATLGFVQLMVPTVVHVQPAGTGLRETNVVLAGKFSVNVALEQLLGPPFVTVCV